MVAAHRAELAAALIGQSEGIRVVVTANTIPGTSPDIGLAIGIDNCVLCASVVGNRLSMWRCQS